MYRWLDHTSEAELSIVAESPAAVLGEATRALGELLAEAPPGEPVERRVSVEAADLPGVLAEWLSELVYLAETDAFVPEGVSQLELAGTSASGVVRGRTSTPQSLVKGVTYHGLEMKLTDGTWRGHVVLDV